MSTPFMQRRANMPVSMQADGPAEVDLDLNAAFAAKLEQNSREQEEAARARKMAKEIELRANGVPPARVAWGYKTAGPEPEPIFELSGIFSGIVLLFGPVLYLALAGQDLNSCELRPTQEVCKASAPRSQLSQGEQARQEARQRAALNNAMRRQCVRNAASDEEVERCPSEMPMPG